MRNLIRYRAFSICNFVINYGLILAVRFKPTAYFTLELRGACLAKWANHPQGLKDALNFANRNPCFDNFASPFKFRQVKFKKKTSLENDKMSFWQKERNNWHCLWKTHLSFTTTTVQDQFFEGNLPGGII